jgi:P-type Cu+ transporter
LQAAGEVADVVLLSNRPAQVLDAMAVSQATMAKIRQNLVWAFGYNLLGVPVAAGALLPSFGLALSPAVSGALMGMSSLAVMGNSLLLRREAIRPSFVQVEGSGGKSNGSSSVTVAQAMGSGGA